MGKARQRQLQRYVDHQTNSSPARKNRWNLAHLENMYVEGKCARDVTRKEEAVVKEAREPSSQSGTSRYKLGKVAISYWSFFSRYKLGKVCQLLVVFLFHDTSGREEGGEKIQMRGGRSGWRAL